MISIRLLPRSTRKKKVFISGLGFNFDLEGYQAFLGALGIGLDVTAAGFAQAVIKQFTGDNGADIVTPENASPEGKQALDNAGRLSVELSGYLKSKNISSTARVVVTKGDNTFVKFGNRVCGMPTFLRKADDGSLTLYIHQEFLNALYAEQARHAKEGLPLFQEAISSPSSLAKKLTSCLTSRTSYQTNIFLLFRLISNTTISGKTFLKPITVS